MSIDLRLGIVRIIDRDGNTVGTGFLITSNGLIATCAHVIDEAQSGELISLVLYNSSTGKETQEVRRARVQTEYVRSASAEDVAILCLEGPLPKTFTPLPLGRSFNTQGSKFLSFGFPEARPEDGLLGECEVIGIVSEENTSLLQLRSKEISKGFSGAPIWDINRNAVIGMVTSIIGTKKVSIANRSINVAFDSDGRQMETAFATPVETLQKVCPLLQVSEECPYQGLDIFTEEQAHFFYGRDAVIDKLESKLKREIRFLAVLGPSGSGKSSVVRAGLIPRLRQGVIGDSNHWGILVIRPTDNPFKQLSDKGFAVETHDFKGSARAWLTQHLEYTRLVLIVDQFEELLTNCRKAERVDFLEQLTQLLAAPLPITIIVVIRDDFYGQFAQQENLAQWLELNQVNIPSTLKLADVTAIVQKPAEAVRLRFEEGLIELIVRDAMEVTTSTTEEEEVASSAILPLLEFALSQLWEKRDRDGLLTRSAYNDIGRVQGGLTIWADRAFYNLRGEEAQQKAHRIFTDLIYIGDKSQGLPDTRRRMSLARLCRNENELEEVHQIVQQLASSRLLVTTYDAQSKQEMVDIIHDALLREWGQLRQWIEKDRKFLTWRQELERRVRAWVETNAHDAAQRDVYKLFGGPDLAEAIDWLKEHSDDLSQDEQDFILASQRRQEQEEKMQIRYKRRIFLVGLLGVGMAVGVGATTWEMFGRTDLVTQKTPVFTYSEHSNAVNSAAWSPDNKLIASSDDNNKVYIWDARSGKTYLIYQRHSDTVKKVSWSPDGTRIVSSSTDKTAHIWDTTTGETLLIYKGHTDAVRESAWSPDGKLIASASWDNTVQVWHATTGETLLIYKGHTDSVYGVAWSPNGKLIASSGQDQTVQIWDPTSAEAGTGKYIHAYRAHQNTVKHIAWSPSGQLIASASYDATAHVWDVATGTILSIYKGHTNSVSEVAWSLNGQLIASSSDDTTVQVWNAFTGDIQRIYKGHSQTVNDVMWSRTGEQIVSASDDTKVLIWQAP